MSIQASSWLLRRNRLGSSRTGAIVQQLVLATILVAVIAATIWYSVGRRDADSGEAPLIAEVVRGPYEHIVLEQGEVESSNNVELRCEVKNRTGGNTPATTILDVIPEGTPVKKGDWLVTFDSSALETELTQQTILAKTAETLVIQSKAAYETGVMAKTEYVEGTYEQERKTIENEIFVAEESLKKAELSHDSIQRSVARGLISPLQLEGEQFRVDAARKELELAKQKLHVLDNYTKAKMVTQLKSDIEATKIQYENAQASYQEELKTLEEIQQQISKCKVYAPQDGLVVYANVLSSRSSSEFVVEAGAAVRERQEIIMLPDPTNMQVTAQINENLINLVREGMSATIRVDALGDRSLEGVVTKVNKFAEAGNWWSASGKEYETTIRIVDPPPQIRTGLTAEVRILVEDRSDALQVPVQAILEYEGRTFGLVRTNTGYQTRRVDIASTNNKAVALDESVSSGLNEHEQVVLNPRQHMDKFDFSAFPDLVEQQVAATPESDARPTDDSGEATPVQPTSLSPAPTDASSSQTSAAVESRGGVLVDKAG